MNTELKAQGNTKPDSIWVNGVEKVLHSIHEGKAKSTEEIVPIGSNVLIEIAEIVSSTALLLDLGKQSNKPAILSTITVVGIGDTTKGVNCGEKVLLANSDRISFFNNPLNRYKVDAIRKALDFEKKGSPKHLDVMVIKPDDERELETTIPINNVLVHMYGMISNIDIIGINIHAWNDAEEQLITKARNASIELIKKWQTLN
jgi:hypothetical protein